MFHNLILLCVSHCDSGCVCCFSEHFKSVQEITRYVRYCILADLALTFSCVHRVSVGNKLMLSVCKVNVFLRFI